MSSASELNKLIQPRDFLAAMEGYIPGEQPRGGGWVKLNTNEFPYPAAPEVIEAIQRAATDAVRVYPDPSCTALREALAARHGVDPENILIGNGSDEILRYLAHTFLARDRKLAVVRPTYVLYAVLAAMFEAQVIEYPLEDQQHLPESLFQAARNGDFAACFLPVPNPPLGTLWPGDQLLRLAEGGSLLVLDGAYIDFIDSNSGSGVPPLRAQQSPPTSTESPNKSSCGTAAPGCDPPSQPSTPGQQQCGTGTPAGASPEPLSIAETLAQYPNIVFTRTFSKSFGLAGMRVGYIIARSSLINDKLRDSYNVNRISQATALAAVQAAPYYRQRCNEIIASRTTLTRELTARGFTIPPSQGNFIFAQHPNAPAIFADLKSKKILVRHFNHSGLEGGLRITIGTPEENAALLAAI